MKFSLKVLLAGITLLCICSAWWIDHRNLSERVMELENRDQVRVVELAHEPTFSVKDSALSTIPKWDDAQSRPPVAVSQVRQVAEEMLGQIKALNCSTSYGSIWIQSIRLVPIVDLAAISDSPSDWCYVIDFLGHYDFPKSIKNKRDGGRTSLTGPSSIYRAAVLMDGSIYSCRQRQTPIVDAMKQIYPSSSAFEQNFVKTWVKKRKTEIDQRPVTVGGQTMSRGQHRAQVQQLLKQRLGNKVSFQ